MYQNYDAALSKTIMFLRFPLIVSVVFIHAGLEGVVIGGNVTVHDGQFPIYESVYHVITNELARVSVPLFFFISGFLFFYRTDFSMKAYGQKLKKRVRTLFGPVCILECRSASGVRYNSNFHALSDIGQQ